MHRFVVAVLGLVASSTVVGCGGGGGGGAPAPGVAPVTSAAERAFPLARAERTEVDLAVGPWRTTALLHVGSPDGEAPALMGVEDGPGEPAPGAAAPNARYRLEDVKTGALLREGSLFLAGLDGARFPAEADVRVRVPRLAPVERLVLLPAEGTTPLATVLLIAPPY